MDLTGPQGHRNPSHTINGQRQDDQGQRSAHEAPFLFGQLLPPNHKRLTFKEPALFVGHS